MTYDMSGRNLRTLTSGFERYRMESPFKNWTATPDGKFGVGITTGMEGVRSEIWMAELPPVRTDSWDRTGLIPMTFNVPAVAGAHNVIAEYGYVQYGDPGASKFNCIDRDDTCVGAASQTATDPYWFAASESFTGVSCASGCPITLNVVGNQVGHYRLKWRNGNAIVKTSPVLPLITP